MESTENRLQRTENREQRTFSSFLFLSFHSLGALFEELILTITMISECINQLGIVISFLKLKNEWIRIPH